MFSFSSEVTKSVKYQALFHSLISFFSVQTCARAAKVYLCSFWCACPTMIDRFLPPLRSKPQYDSKYQHFFFFSLFSFLFNHNKFSVLIMKNRRYVNGMFNIITNPQVVLAQQRFCYSTSLPERKLFRIQHVKQKRWKHSSFGGKSEKYKEQQKRMYWIFIIEIW